MRPITMYATRTCRFCHHAMQFLLDHQIGPQQVQIQFDDSQGSDEQRDNLYVCGPNKQFFQRLVRESRFGDAL